VPAGADAARWPEWSAAADWQAIDLLSDVHLHPGMPRTFEAWRAHLLHTPADAVLMLGDLFEVWVGDDARHSGFEADCAEVLRQAARQRPLAFLPGNRDFLVGPDLLADTGVQALADPTVLLAFGRRWLLSHGDALCLSDVDYMRFRDEVRQPAWQARFLAQPLPLRQAQARAMRDASSQRQAAMAPADWSDVDAAEADRWLARAQAPVLVHGHTHRPGVHALPGGGQRHVLGDWDLDLAPRRARILRLSAAGLQPLDLAAAA
jgi:UDP-2,3-diacylglucosamine hydrolase